MDKRKRLLTIGIGERLLQATSFDHTVICKPREFTRHMTTIVRYPKLINDVGRTVDVRRIDDNRYAFELRQKRYLGRGTYAISARAKGIITYDTASQRTNISGYVQLGGQYVTLLSIMTAFVLISLGIVFVTILFLPLACLTLAILGLHWLYLRADQRDLQEKIEHLVDLTEREMRLKENDIPAIALQPETATVQLSAKQ